MDNGAGGDPGLWRDVGRFALYILGVVIVYTILVAIFSPDELVGWISTLISTIASVFSALAIGLLLYRYQSRENDRKKYGELSALLKTELGEIAKVIEENQTTINVTTYTKLFNPLVFEARLKKHYPNPLVVDEAVKSGLFSAKVIAKPQSLGRLMRAHQLEVQYAVNSVPLVMEESPETARYGAAVQSVRDSEDRLVRACKEVMGLIVSETGTFENATSVDKAATGRRQG